MNPPRILTIQTPTCVHCGKGGEVQVTADDWARYRAGAHAQNAFPEMTPDLREQLILGTHGPCWDALWADFDEDADDEGDWDDDPAPYRD